MAGELPASVETTHCNGHSLVRSRWLPYECTGVWRQAGGSDRTVTVHGVPRYGPHQSLDVHIRGDQAYTNSVREGWVELSWGDIFASRRDCGAAALALVALAPIPGLAV